MDTTQRDQDKKGFHAAARTAAITAIMMLATTGNTWADDASPEIGQQSLATRSSNVPAVNSSGAVIHGVNFLVRNLLDESFCIETDVAVSATPSVYMAACTGASSQRWTFTDGADGSSVVIGDRGFCLTVSGGPTPHLLVIAACDYRKEQRFLVTPAGEILRKGSDDCLTLASPVSTGNPIFIEECADPAVHEQLWRLIL